MRSLIAIVVPALLSLNLIACASDDSSESTHVVQNPLVQEGGSCSKNSDCASNLCGFEKSIGIKGLPAPCDGDNCSNGQPVPAPEGEPLPAGDDDDDDNTSNVKGKPSPEPTPTPDPRGRPEPQPAPAPAPAPLPAPAPNPTGICIAR